MKRVLLTGHRGMLGQALHRRLPHAVGFDLPEGDITNRDAVRTAVRENRTEVVINCAAYTRVDDAETDEKEAHRVNAEAVGCLADAARQNDAYLLTLSTDYVFAGEGETSHLEKDPTGPLSAYGRTKLAGEQAVQAIGGRWCIVRTQWLYGAGGKNFVDTIRELSKQREELRVVADQFGAPTWTEDLASTLVQLAERETTGIYHAANDGYASWYEVARMVVEESGGSSRVVPCTSEEYPTPAPRPRNSRLSLDKLSRLLGHRPRPWQEALREYLNS